MSKQFIFLDDAGDTGIKNSATGHFVVAAIIVDDSKNLENLIVAMNGFRAGLGWVDMHELKFNSTKKSIIRNLLQFITQFEFFICAAVIDKAKITVMPQLASGESLYNFTIKELLLRLNLSEPIIFIDGVAHKRQAERVRTYLRQSLKEHGVNKCKIRFVDSRKDVLIQLADVVAGSIARSYNKEKNDHNDYLNLIESKVKGIFEISPQNAESTPISFEIRLPYGNSFGID